MADHAITEQTGMFAESQYRNADESRWRFHDSADPLIRYVRDRRLRMSVAAVTRELGCSCSVLTVLVLCGGVGGEASYLANSGFQTVVLSDISPTALEIAKRRDPRLTTLVLDAENIALPDRSYDIILVQDGLHHLPRPALGLTEMIRVAKRAVIVIEPHCGLIADVIGTKWENENTDNMNWVFRWNRQIFEQVARSYLLKSYRRIRVMRFWDHSGVMYKFGNKVGGGVFGMRIVQCVYAILNLSARRAGNAMIGIVVK